MYEEIFPEDVEALIMKEKPINIIDVREPFEFKEEHIAGAVNIPLNELPSCCKAIDPSKTYIVVCHAGVRSVAASEFMAEHGYTVKNMSGGMMEWTGGVERDPN
ncbi:rhodanese-like domain-containing protein [Sporolactobacillus terrae]|uniref:Rhodanese-like domain-containing protein n=1 Tax=Sporolactobacillus terrae TaxID=269673 RepID=A0ABX5Q824_9BACL|nr:rhodanese-like domain-containing protein [Sporolactobacillus terrae]QAA22787.1 rhodanese-like domain-containing protein [Sporolactobacillus terrae]QAA25760.1 rhodanese-like domain-containing protein [Sporolactobacillus terrae]UAK17638.1 rhodanese-like domain-containing protein [Sporolactobacillus terrae]